MSDKLHESTMHGSAAFPFALYHIHCSTRPCAFPLHWHDEVEIILVQQGILELTIGNTHYRGQPGDVYIVNAGQIHEMSVRQVPTVYATILFPMTSLLFQQDDDIRRKYLLPLADRTLQFPNETTTLTFRGALREKLEALILLYRRKEGCYELRIRTLLLEILCDFFSETQALVPVRTSPAQEKQQEILAYLRQNAQNELSLAAVAGAFHMVPKYFSHYFKKTFHITLTEHLTALRLEAAAAELRRTDLPVTEIALRAGFNSCSYFNKQFRRVYHTTPTQYRRQQD